MRCKNCNAEVQEFARFCPHCGVNRGPAPMSLTRMVVITVGIVIVILIMILKAGEKPEVDTTPTGTHYVILAGYGCAEKEDCYRTARAYTSGDKEGTAAMLVSGRVVPLEKNTKVDVFSMDENRMCHVEVESGFAIGKTLYVPAGLLNVPEPEKTSRN